MANLFLQSLRPGGSAGLRTITRLPQPDSDRCWQTVQDSIGWGVIMDAYARAGELLLQADVSAAEADEVATWVAKKGS